MYLFGPCASQVAGPAAHSGSRCSPMFSESLCPSSKTRKAPPTAPRCWQWSARVNTRRCGKCVGRSSAKLVCSSRGKKSGSCMRRGIEYTSGFIQQFGECEIGNWTNPAPQIRNPKSQIGLRFEISDFGFEVQDSSNFKFRLDLIAY